MVLTRCRECQQPVELHGGTAYCYGYWAGIEIERLRTGLEVIRELLVLQPASASGSSAYGNPHDLRRVIDSILESKPLTPAAAGT